MSDYNTTRSNGFSRFDPEKYEGINFLMKDGTTYHLRDGKFGRNGESRKITRIAGIPATPFYARKCRWV